MPYQNLHKILICTFLLVTAFFANAQIKPDATTTVLNPTGTVTIPFKPSDYASGTLVNYIRTWQPQQPTTDEAYVTSSGRTVDQVNISTQYFDGLGRQLQTVGWQTSPGKQDIVAPTYYDPYGREPYKFLPYTSPTASASGNQAQFKVSPFTEQSTFYTTTYKTEQPALTNEKFFYNKTNYEASPLNRVTNNFAPGNSWAGSEGSASEKNTKAQYLFNNVNDDVKMWSVGINLVANVTNAGGGNQYVEYRSGNVSPPNVTTMVYLYRVLGSTGSWTTAGVGGPTAYDYLVTIPTGTYEYAVQLWFNGTTTMEYVDPTAPNYYILGSYSPGELYKNISIDENGMQVVEFKDKEGKVILKKVQLNNTVIDGYTGWLCTYYLYDNFGQLRFVISPKAVAALTANNWVLSQSIIDELCFQYHYDPRLRMTAKKVPGSGWVYMVYDQRDRLVFSQDANMRSKTPQQWMYTLYDDISRPAQTGIMTYIGSWATLQASIPGTETTVANSGTNQNVNPADMYINSRETGRPLYQSTNSITFDNGFTSEDNASFTAQITTETPSTFSNNVIVNTYPVPTSGTTLYPLTYTYYDDYTATTKIYSTTNNSKLDDGGNLYPETLPSTNSTLTRGMVTMTKVRVIEDPNNLSLGKWLETTNFYDEKARVIQVQSTNYKGGNDIVTNRYDFTGKVVSNYVAHNNISGNVNNLRVLSTMNYDHVGRLETVTKTINDDAANTRKIVTNSYDALGQLKNKKTGQKSATDATPLEDDNYNYNIRGWLKDINYYASNGAYASQMSIGSDKWFSMDLSYDWGFGTANQYNGNISGTRWKTAGDGQERAYGFAYDKANRLLKGDFTQYGTVWATDLIVDFSMKIGDGVSTSTYDENGNIIKMWQRGITGVTNGIIDDLTYSYFPMSNKLSAVGETSPIDNKLGDFTDNNTSGNDYGYDVNGNLITDLNKRITGTTGIDQTTGGAITYNFLNLPWKIAVMNADGIHSEGTITYIYDAAGNKLEKRVDEAPLTYNNNVSRQTTTTYLGGFIYENNVLQFFSHEEGRTRYRADKNTFVYDYFIKDHLGNVRMVLRETEPVPLVNYYPAATLEGVYDGLSNTMVNHESKFYSINNTFIFPEASIIPTWAPESAANTKLYFNNNSNPSSNVAPVSPPNLSYPSGCSPTQIAGSNNLYKLNAGTQGNQTGLMFMIHVMAGDHIDIFGKSYYVNATTVDNTNSTLLNLTTLMTNLLLAPTNAATAKGITAAQLSSLNPGSTLSNFFRGNNTESPTTIPKAYINYIFFDEQFKYAGGDASRVGPTSGSVYDHWYQDPATKLQNILVPKNGYIFVYVSNESNFDVYFDNLQVIHKPGPLLEEMHYYPFGLTMAGISSKAPGGLENKYKYNKGSELQHQEFSDGSGLEMYDTHFRQLDPQLGRWWQIDPKPDFAQSLYSAMGNNPVLFNDPLGDTTFLYNRGGAYRGHINDGLNTNEIVIAKGLKIGLLKVGKALGFYSSKAAGLTARSAAFADGRITNNTIKELTGQWKNSSGENVGLLYADSKTKEVHSVRCSSCSGTGATASLDNLKGILPEASLKGNVIGAWHTHPENGYQASTKIDKEDVTNPAVAIPSFASGALGVIVNRNTITPYSINSNMTSYTENDQDEITSPKYSPNYSDFKADFQNPVFTTNVNSKTYWDQ